MLADRQVGEFQGHQQADTHRRQEQPDSLQTVRVRTKILDNLISEQLLDIQAQKEGIKIDEAQVQQAVDAAIQGDRERLGAEGFAAELQKEGITEAQLRARYTEGARSEVEKRTGKPALRQMRSMARTACASLFASPSRLRTTSPSRMVDIRLSASWSVVVIGTDPRTLREVPHVATQRRRAAGETNFQNKPPTQYPFDDSDVYKAIEGASFCMSVQPDSAVAAQVESYIKRIAAVSFIATSNRKTSCCGRTA